MIYVGRHLRSAIGTTEPALINPDLPVARHHCATAGHDLAPYPSYHLISASERAAYLAWLADGRRDTRVPIGVVWLFFFGLERRVLLDAAGDPAARPELPAIAAEVRRLRALYGTGNPSFHTCSSSLLDALELLSPHSEAPPAGEAPPAPRGERSPVPMALRIALSRYAAAGMPVPADVARSWAWFHPALLPRTPQTRCAEEFDRLFRLRYTQRFGAGLVPRPSGTPLELSYQPSSPGLTTVAVSRADLPDVLKEPTATRELGVLVDAVTGALDPYSRWLTKAPDGRGTLAATALLPAELLDRDTGALGQLASWADAHLAHLPSADQPGAVIDAAEFTAFWSVAHPERMAKDEVVSLMQVLSRIGLGVEPDVRFGGPALTPGPAVLFRLGDDAPDHARPEFRTAATMLHLAAGVVSATGAAADGVEDPIVAELATTVRLTPAERTRLRARLRWLLTAEVAGTGLSRRIAALDQPERTATGHFLIAVAAGARIVSPAAVAALTSAYRMLGLDTELVIRRLHQRSIGGGSPDRASHRHAEEPVVARRGGRADPGHALPWAAMSPTAEGSPAAAGGVPLNQAAISRKITETTAVDTLLAAIFVDDEPIGGAPAATAGPDGAPDLDRTDLGPTDLDPAHRDLLRELGTRTSWARTDFAALAARYGVLPNGAVDLLNEVAMETAGEPVCEGDGDLVINSQVLQELLR